MTPLETASPAPEGDAGRIEALKASIRRWARYGLAKEWEDLDDRERFLAVSLAAREPIIERMLASERRFAASGVKRIYYLSMEYLPGRALAQNLINIGLYQPCVAALLEMGADLERILEVEPDPALGNGGLGRLASCLLDSMATLGVAGYGYGINYEYGLFRQEIVDGWQVEKPDVWRFPGSPWLILRPDLTRTVSFYGEAERDPSTLRGSWRPEKDVHGVPSDMPVVGYGGRNVTFMRLYAAQSTREFDVDIFNSGDYVRAVESKIESERISKILYPSDDLPAGRELRLMQEYFFVSCALRDILERHLAEGEDAHVLPERAAVQLNDTHPSLAVPELVRILVDERGVPFEEAARIARGTFSYTNHTLLPEAQETWSSALVRRVLPRHAQILEDLDALLRREAQALGVTDEERLGRLSIVVADGEPKYRMMHLSVAFSHHTNGVSRLHTDLLVRRVVRPFHELWPERFVSETNGVTPRRFLLHANPPLAGLLARRLGDRWITDLEALGEAEPLADDSEFLGLLRAIRRRHKERLSRLAERLGLPPIDPDSLVDAHVKRFHEYKRQSLNALRIVYDYLRVVEDGWEPPVPRTFVFSGKAAPGYFMAKLIIKLVNDVAAVVAADPKARRHLRVLFLPDYRVTLAERIIPASDVGEQISTAGMEASGTGNMKFTMNGALTVGTLDGANIEIRERVGEENFYAFGLTVEEIERRRESGFHPREVIEADERVARVLQALRSGPFRADDGRFDPLLTELEECDRFFVLSDFGAFLEAHERVLADFGRPEEWFRRAALNIFRSGPFSSDRTVRGYARDVWGIETAAPRGPGA